MSQPGRAGTQFLTPLMSPGPSGLRSPALRSPKPTDLFFRRTTVGANGSTVSVNDIPAPSGLRAQLGHLLPRHAYFRAHIVIHEISSVPFVGGEFAVQWKFKGVQNSPGSKPRLLRRTRSRTDNRTGTDDLKSPDDGLFSPRGLDSIIRATAAQNSPSLSSRGSEQSGGHLSVSVTAASSASSLSTTIPQTPTTPIIPDTSNVASARGMTPFLPLKDHSVVWSQSLDTILKFDIDRETSYILQNPLRLVVFQRVVPGDPHGNPQNPRLGAVYLNLSEYVGQGSVNRRYLLKESKTNSILKLTIELEHLSGETTYIPPPLAKGEILNGIAGYLEKESVKKRPRPLDLYGPYKNQEELETDLLSGLKSTARVAKTARSERKISDVTFTSLETETEDDESHETTSFEETDARDEANAAFDVQRLPNAYGTKTTEVLIDSLFNPVKVSDQSEESPFTIYEPPSPELSIPQINATPKVKGCQGHRTSPSYQRTGLGIFGLSQDLNKTGDLPSRRSTFGTEESSSVHTSTSDSASELSHTSSSFQRVPIAQKRKIIGARSTPEGRMVFEGQGSVQSQLKVASDDLTTVGVMRSWWKRNLSRQNVATAKTPNQANQAY